MPLIGTARSPGNAYADDGDAFEWSTELPSFHEADLSQAGSTHVSAASDDDAGGGPKAVNGEWNDVEDGATLLGRDQELSSLLALLHAGVLGSMGNDNPHGHRSR